MRAYNFCAGPAALPTAVLERAQTELADWHARGLSIMEMSHRSADFVAVAEKAEADLRSLLSIPENYKVLFLQGGASLQFSAIPLNLLGAGQTADYIDTGIWSQKAIAEGRRHAEVVIAATARESGYTGIPGRSSWQVPADAAYLHYTANETIGGVEFQEIPDADGLPLVADVSSNFLSRPLDITRFAAVYAGAQKNAGPAGITVVIVREDQLGRASSITPSILDWQKQAENGSMLNTPPTYNWYLLGLVLDWLKAGGGIAAIEQRNIRKAARLYAAIDGSGFYSSPVDPVARSRMNVPFRLGNPDLEKTFLAEARTAGLVNLEGHRSVGGLRASIYNAMPEAGVDALIAFMSEFERQYG